MDRMRDMGIGKAKAYAKAIAIIPKVIILFSIFQIQTLIRWRN